MQFFKYPGVGVSFGGVLGFWGVGYGNFKARVCRGSFWGVFLVEVFILLVLLLSAREVRKVWLSQ